MAVLAPMLTGIVVRTFAWMALPCRTRARSTSTLIGRGADLESRCP